MAGSEMITVKGLLRHIGILPDEYLEAGREERRLEELHKTDERQREKLTYADSQLEKVKRNQMSEEEFWRLLEMWPDKKPNEDSDASG